MAYPEMREGKVIEESYPLNGILELRIGDVILALSETASMTLLKCYIG